MSSRFMLVGSQSEVAAFMRRAFRSVGYTGTLLHTLEKGRFASASVGSGVATVDKARKAVKVMISQGRTLEIRRNDSGEWVVDFKKVDLSRFAARIARKVGMRGLTKPAVLALN